jgi:CubicO group peptidase (beta-lactamase class C family)
MNTHALDKSLQFIDSWLQLRCDQEEFPGFAVAVAHKGKLVFNQAYGYADLEHKTELTPAHMFRIASQSKTFTATALMQLQEAGKLRIDDYAVQYLPWLGKHTDKRWQNVTLRQLMSHGAGMIRDGVDGDFWQLERPFPDVAELQQAVLQADLVLENNTKLKYSNFGYSLLGMVVETVSGQPYNEYVSEHVVRALGLKNTIPEYTPELDSKLATGYTRRDRKTRLPIAHVNTEAMAAATGFCANAADLCTYFSAHMVGSGKLLSDESKKEMQRLQYLAYTPGGTSREGYGLGLNIGRTGERHTLGHGGGFPGFITKSNFDPKDELAVVALTNSQDGPATMIVNAVYAIIDYFQKHAASGRPKHDMSRLEGRYYNIESIIHIVATGDKAAVMFPNSWTPFRYVEELEYVDDTTLRLGEIDSYGSEGELVSFALKNGAVETVCYNAVTMWPETAWFDLLARHARVGMGDLKPR